jgi:hypothetical protein
VCNARSKVISNHRIPCRSICFIKFLSKKLTKIGLLNFFILIIIYIYIPR